MFKVEFEGLEVESDVPVCWLGMGSGGVEDGVMARQLFRFNIELAV